jgi:cellulose synthase (UDP-forming)
MKDLSQKILGPIRKWFSDVFGTRTYLRYNEKEDRWRRVTGQILTLLTAVLGLVYLYWHWTHINWTIWYYSFTFFVAELTGLALFCFFSVNAWFLRYHAPDGITVERNYSVDVFIPVAGEPIEIVRDTVEAALKITFQNKQIYILDDKGRPEYRELAEHFGCGYFAREEHNDAKAGNLNYAIKRTKGDLILALDADQVPQSQIIDKLIGYFKFPQVAFVQSKQNFKVPVGDPFGNSDRIFYNIMQSGKDNDNSAFSCGSGVMYRREALDDIGGFSTWNLVEDVHTSMRLHERGWRSVYYNHSLTTGTAPDNIYGVYRQRRQWAADSLRIEFWDNPFRFCHRGLTLKQRLQYFHLGFVYLVAAFIMPLFFITPIACLLVQEFILTASVHDYVLHRFPYFLSMSLAYGIINYPTPYMKAFQMWTGLFPVFIQATFIALFSSKKKPTYRVNPKPTGTSIVKRPWLAVLPQLAIILSGLFAVFYSFLIGAPFWDFFLLNTLWIIWSVWTLSGICKAALKKHKWPKKEDMPEKAPSFLSGMGELAITCIVTIAVTVFFITVDSSKVNSFMSNLRLQVLETIDIEKYIPQKKEDDIVEKMMARMGPIEDYDAPRKVPVQQPEQENLKASVISEQDQNQSTKSVPGKMEAAPELKKKEQAWVIQVKSERNPEKAEKCKEMLLDAGFQAFISPAKIKENSWMRVRVGYFASRDEAQKVSIRIKRIRSVPQDPHWILKRIEWKREAVNGG